jgi:hypothetical protein
MALALSIASSLVAGKDSINHCHSGRIYPVTPYRKSHNEGLSTPPRGIILWC